MEICGEGVEDGSPIKDVGDAGVSNCWHLGHNDRDVEYPKFLLSFLF
jgi:hypothetical protein